MQLVLKRAVIAAIAAAGIGTAAGACAGSPSGQPSGRHGVSGTWTIVSCQVDVTYISATNTADYYVPDTDANFQRYFVPKQASGDAGIAIVATFVNNASGPAPLPADLVVSFTDQSGSPVGSRLSFNGPYGSAVANGRGSGEAFSSGTLFNPGQTVAESPDIGASAPRQPDLSCSVSRQ